MIDFKDLAQVIDLDLEQWYIPYVVCKQHDAKSRFLKIKLFNRGEPVVIDDELTIFYCYFRKGDGKEVFSITFSKVTVEKVMVRKSLAQ